MHLLFMKAFLLREIRFFSSRASLLAMSLDNNFAKEYIRLMGQNSVIRSALGFFGMRTTSA
jgi:hypothetical protein